MSLLPAAEPPSFAGPVVAGQLEAPPKLETSGLAASRRNPGLLWTHDDSGGAATLYAVTAEGRRLGALHLRGVKNEDWEDLAACELDGQAVIVVGDTGDNDAKRPTIALHFVAEPALAELKPDTELRARPLRTLTVRYEDGPRDCEAMAVDVTERAIYLLTKRDEPPRLYRVPLDAPDGELAVARRVGAVPHLPLLSAAQRVAKGYLGRRRGEVTALDFAPDGSAALVLTYGDLLLFPRRAGEAWAEALARPPVRLREPALVQAEAACFSADGRQLFVAAEGIRTLLRYNRR
ncbi:MAG: hypothetical protein Q8N18_15805 [Opitutaceae bacterium]|nr:hypothetical protein [Opitutaceae bacterium]